MKSNYVGRKIFKKAAYSLMLLLVAGLVSLGTNYRSTGTLTKVGRKLPIYSVQTSEKKVAITFDVNWGTDYTEKILDILDKQQVKATFFLIGLWIDQYPEVAKEIYQRGHEIGNHSNRHPDMTVLSKEKVIQDVAAADAKVMNITGEIPKLFRCPAGNYNDQVIETVEGTGHTIIQWDVDSIDWREEGADIELDRVLDKTKPGSILLFHNTAKYTPENLVKVIEKLKGQGYTFVKVGDLICKSKYHLDSFGKQIPDS